MWLCFALSLADILLRRRIRWRSGDGARSLDAKGCMPPTGPRAAAKSLRDVPSQAMARIALAETSRLGRYDQRKQKRCRRSVSTAFIVTTERRFPNAVSSRLPEPY
jgi:hypothetical protein